MATGKMQTERRAGFNVAATDTDDIKTIVFTAIATTGWLRGNPGKDLTGEPRGYDPTSAKITALCFMPISKLNLEKNKTRKSIVNKFIIYCNPQKEIHSDAVKASGLAKDDLLYFETFEQQARMVVDFLKNLPKPIRLVAHQGDIFHFRLLFLHLNQKISDVTEFQDFVCTDSLKVAREMYPDLESHTLDEWHKQRTGGEPIVGAEGRCQMLLEIVRSFSHEELEEFFTLCGRIKCMFSHTKFDEKKGQLCVDAVMC